MKKITKYLILVSMVVFFAFLQPVLTQAADVPNTLNYQGYLTDNTGQPITGSHQITCKLYTALSGGTPFWTETNMAQVNEGRFAVVLGKDAPGFDLEQFTGETFIGITVGSGTEMVPRQQFTSVAYALKAGSLMNMPQTIPQGLIAMWSGSTVPVGWALCNGQNGTPNLTDRFIVGAGNTYSVGATGGSATKNLEHTHAGPAHNHTYSGTTGGPSAQDSYDETNEQAGANMQHTHNYSGTTSSGGTGSTGIAGSSTQDITPPYYALAFIMKL